MTNVNILVYDSKCNFLGYKCDTLWEVRKDERRASIHHLERGKIPERYISNLIGILNEKPSASQKRDLADKLKVSEKLFSSNMTPDLAKEGLKVIVKKVVSGEKLVEYEVFFNSNQEEFQYLQL